MKGQDTDLEKIFSNCISDKGIISGIYKELSKLNSNLKKNFTIQTQGKERTFIKDTWRANKHMIRYSTSLATSSMQINTISKYTAHLWEELKQKIIETPNGGKDVEKLSHTLLMEM